MLNYTLHRECVHRAQSRVHTIIDCGFTLSVQERQEQVVRGGKISWYAEFNCNSQETLAVSCQSCITKAYFTGKGFTITD